MQSQQAPGIEVLADPTRREIVARLATHPYRPSVLARELGLAPSTISHHLRILESAGIVRRLAFSVEDRVRLYRLDPSSTGRVIAWLAGTGIALPTSPAADPDGLEGPAQHTSR